MLQPHSINSIQMENIHYQNEIYSIEYNMYGAFILLRIIHPFDNKKTTSNPVIQNSINVLEHSTALAALRFHSFILHFIVLSILVKSLEP